MSIGRLIAIRVTLVLCALLALPEQQVLGAFGFIRIADTSTPIPNENGNFTGFDPSPIIGGTGVAFRAFGAGQEGIYTGNGASLQRLADRNTIVPGSTTPFESFDTPSGAFGSVYFRAGNLARVGIYRAVGGTVSTITDAPFGTNFGRVGASSDAVAFRQNGVIMTNRSGSVQPFSFTPPSGVTSYTFIGDPDIGDWNLVIGGMSPIGVAIEYVRNGTPYSGIAYSRIGGADQIRLETSVDHPDSPSISWSGEIATKIQNVGVRYTVFEGEYTIPPGTSIPEGTGGFTSFGNVSTGSPNLGMSDTAVIFVGFGAGGQEGIYFLGRPFGLSKFIARGDKLDGKIVDHLDLGRDSEFGGGTAFWVSFTDGSSAIYHVGIPEPGGALVAGCAAVLVLARWRTRRS